VSGYYIYRKLGSGSYSKIKTISDASTTSYKDKTSLKSGKIYTYKVVAYSKDKILSGASTKSVRYMKASSLSSLKNSSAKKDDSKVEEGKRYKRLPDPVFQKQQLFIRK